MIRSKINNRGLYIHIPFCVKKCAYCDFASVGVGKLCADSYSISEDKLSYIDRLIDSLIKELDMRSDELQGISTVFIGGGTPSVIPVKYMERLLKKINVILDNNSGNNYSIDNNLINKSKEEINNIYDYGVDNKNNGIDYINNKIDDITSEKLISNGDTPEFTIECNPGTIDEEKPALYKSYGINRISFGLQSVNDDELSALGRIHSYEDFLHSYELAKKAGFDNINIDIMSAIPKQTIASFKHTLDEVIGLRPTHISVYSLIIEEGTSFFDKYANKPPVDEETDRQMFELAHEKLSDAGYIHYEISNYALIDNSETKKELSDIATYGNELNQILSSENELNYILSSENVSGENKIKQIEEPENKFICKHNVNYWRRGEYVGIGPAAASHINNKRTKNFSDINKYIDSVNNLELPIEESEELDKEKQLIEDIYLGLRMSEGIDIKGISEKYDIDFYGLNMNKLNEFAKRGLLCYNKNHIRLTPDGMWVSDYIIDSLII